LTKFRIFQTDQFWRIRWTNRNEAWLKTRFQEWSRSPEPIRRKRDLGAAVANGGECEFDLVR